MGATNKSASRLVETPKFGDVTKEVIALMLGGYLMALFCPEAMRRLYSTKKQLRARRPCRENLILRSFAGQIS
jgi:hypothetical protein